MPFFQCFFICFCFLDITILALSSSSICFNSFASDCSNYFSSYEPLLLFKDSFSVDKFCMSSPIRSKAFSLAGIIETICSLLLARVAINYQLNCFKAISVLLLEDPCFVAIWSCFNFGFVDFNSINLAIRSILHCRNIELLSRLPV